MSNEEIRATADSPAPAPRGNNKIVGAISYFGRVERKGKVISEENGGTGHQARHADTRTP